MVTNIEPADSLAPLSAARAAECYQCGKCSAGCPLGQQMDLLPHQLIRLVQLGQLDRAAASRSVWQCVSCLTCSTRCPKGVDCAGVVDALRQLSLKRGVAHPDQRRTWLFHQAFLDNVRRNGRLDELELIAAYKLAVFAGDWHLPRLLKDAGLAPRLIRRGKFHLRGRKPRDRGVVRRIFQRCEELE